MRTDQLEILLLQTDATTKVVVILVALILFASLSSRTLAQNTQNTCTGTFAGNWGVPTVPGTNLSISVIGDSAEGEYFEGKSHRTLKGKIKGNTLTGDWVEIG